MAKILFNNVSEMQKYLKETIGTSNIEEVVRKTMRDYIDDKVYNNYTPNGVDAYDRTYEVLSAVDIVDKKMGTKHYTFMVYINPDLLTSDNMRSDFGQWNAHASMPQGNAGYDVREFIPLWLEKGTNGSLWDREGAYFNNDTYIELGTSGGLAKTLLGQLRKAGFNAQLE